MLPVRSPIAILEWKAQRPTTAKQKTDDDRAWVEAFSRENPDSLGFLVWMEWAPGGILKLVQVSRCSNGEWNENWFVSTGD